MTVKYVKRTEEKICVVPAGKSIRERCEWAGDRQNKARFAVYILRFALFCHCGHLDGGSYKHNFIFTSRGIIIYLTNPVNNEFSRKRRSCSSSKSEKGELIKSSLRAARGRLLELVNEARPQDGKFGSPMTKADHTHCSLIVQFRLEGGLTK